MDEDEYIFDDVVATRGDTNVWIVKRRGTTDVIGTVAEEGGAFQATHADGTVASPDRTLEDASHALGDMG